MFFFRADGNAEIGAGHLMRCTTIARELAKQLGGTEEIRFVCSDNQSAMLAEQQGFRVLVLGSDYRDMEEELSLWDNLIKKDITGQAGLSGREGQHCLLVDSYFVTDKYLTNLGYWGQVGVMDDFGVHPYPVDFVVNYNAPASLEHYEKLYQEQKTRLIIGSGYIPVREQFLHVDYQVRDQVRAVLITTGGGDKYNIARQIWDMLYDEQLEFHLIVGQFSPHFLEMKGLAEKYRNLHIHYNVNNMADLMRKCDVAVTAGGSTVYELSAIGVPFICFSYAENQEVLTAYIRSTGIAGEAGAWHKDSEETMLNMKKLFFGLKNDRALRMLYWERERKLVDRHGATRLAGVLQKLHNAGRVHA